MLYGFVFMHLNKLIIMALLGYQVVILHLKHLLKDGCWDAAKWQESKILRSTLRCTK